MKFTNWVLAKIDDHRSGEGPRRSQDLQALVQGLQAIRQGHPLLFGLLMTNVEAEGRARIETALVDALLSWRTRLEAEADTPHLVALGEVSDALGLPALHFEPPPVERVPLRCDPLGTRDGLSRKWLTRLERLDELVAGRRIVTGYAASQLAESTARSSKRPGEPATFQAPQTADLYDYVLQYETEMDKAYPRELAALHATVGEIFVGGQSFLGPVTFWSWPGGYEDDDKGVHIGTGSYIQGSLWIKATPGRDPLKAPVIDYDEDDDEVIARFSNLGALLDALMER